jgi:pimeloyl-ACP methyl ester carboxylesterase
MATFERRALKINGIDTVVLTAGRGAPLVYFHGAGTVTRFDFALPWMRDFEVVVPYHPGFGESADDAALTEIQDYVLHYLDLFDALGLKKVRLVGQSMGGYIAATLASQQRDLVERLALVCPIGIPTGEVKTTNFLEVPPEQLPALLAVDPHAVIRHLPTGPPGDAFIQERIKETQTATRLKLGTSPFNPKLPRWLHRISMPTLLVWGKQDKLTPLAQQRFWSAALPKAQVKLFDGGHLVLDESAESVAAIQEFMRG